MTYDKWNEDYSFAVWNVDLSTGQLVESAQLLAKAGYRVDSYSQKIAAALEGAFDKYLALWERQIGPMSQEEAAGYRAATLSPANYALDGGEVDFLRHAPGGGHTAVCRRRRAALGHWPDLACRRVSASL